MEQACDCSRDRMKFTEHDPVSLADNDGLLHTR
jgi:hypothetical protein